MAAAAGVLRDSSADKAFEGSKTYTFKWAISHLKEKLEVAYKERINIDSEPFEIQNEKGDKVVFSLCLKTDYAYANHELVYNFRPILVKQLSICPQDDFKIWWRVTLESQASRRWYIKFNLQSDTVRQNISNFCSTQSCRTSELKDVELYQVVLEIEALWPKKSEVTKDESENIQLKGIEQLITNGKYSDIRLACKDGKQFSCHKLILGTQSSVFDRMFSNENCLEVKKGLVTIKDMSKEELEAFLKFLYTGKFDESMKKHAKALLVAGDKYDIQGLVAIVEGMLSATISVSNAIDILLFADKHNAGELRKKAMKVIIADFAQVSKQPKWQELKNDNYAIVSLIEISVENLKL